MSINKRIYQLDQMGGKEISESDFLPIDRQDSSETKKITVQDFLGLTAKTPEFEKDYPNYYWARKDGSWVRIEPQYTSIPWSGFFIGEVAGTKNFTTSIDGVEKYYKNLVILCKFLDSTIVQGSTLNVNNLGEIPIHYVEEAATSQSVGGTYFLVYDGAVFQPVFGQILLSQYLNPFYVGQTEPTEDYVKFWVDPNGGADGQVLPIVTATDNGKNLVVRDGAWVADFPSEGLTVEQVNALIAAAIEQTINSPI